MDSNFKKIPFEALNDNVFKLIGNDWMLITAGKPGEFNMMTASWGGFGILWHKPVTFIFIRPQRYTFNYVEKTDYFTLSFFEKKYKDILNICGSQSGRNVNKLELTGLTPIYTDLNNIIYNQSILSIECKKIYFNDINPAFFIDKSINDVYPINDYHRMFIGEIVNIFQKK